MKKGRKFGHIVTEETRIKIGLSSLGNKYCLGKKASQEARLKMRLAKLGKKMKPNSKEKLRVRMLGNKYTKGIKLSEEHKNKISKKLKGKKVSIETRKKLSEIKKGSKTNFWKGGLTEKNKTIRKSFEMRIAREECFKRDNWTCKECGKRGKIINAHHIKPFSLYPELRFDVNNLITLCRECHKKTDTYGWKSYHIKPLK